MVGATIEKVGKSKGTRFSMLGRRGTRGGGGNGGGGGGRARRLRRVLLEHRTRPPTKDWWCISFSAFPSFVEVVPVIYVRRVLPPTLFGTTTKLGLRVG